MIQGSGDLYRAILRGIIGSATDKTLLDLCCGEMSQTSSMPFTVHHGVDLVDWPSRPKKQSISFEQSDIRTWVNALIYDVALLSDALEHLKKEDGFSILGKMMEWGRQSIVFTPIGSYCYNPGDNSDDPNRHKSGWMPEEFTALGWKTIAFPGWHKQLGIGAFFAWTP